MYDKVQHINDIMCLPTKYWTEEQRELVDEYFSRHSSPYMYPGDEGHQCTHPEWETRYLFTSVYRVCKVCGLDEGDL